MSGAWVTLPDLASRRAGGAVVWANDETFAERENLITPAAPGFRPATFGHKGQVYDGWETRRRREPGDDHAIVRLGMPGVLRGVVVDTAFFTGNYPPACTVSACAVTGYPDVDELLAADWTVLVDRGPLDGDTRNEFDVDSPRRFTHVRLTIHPDGGVARLRAHGDPVADPARLDPDALDLAALEHGGRITACSNMFYSTPSNLIAPGPAAVMGEGWETARRRDDGNDWVVVRLAAAGVIRFAELDTTHFKGNAPGWATLSGSADGESWFTLLDRTRLQPDTRHRFALHDVPETTHARLDIFPDGGMARLRLHGALTADGRAELQRVYAESDGS
ncbi:allantoicase [Actinokineospora sp. NBRC 105648]|uniref:allantoicase n=1 Tax=Actinokineospora sp. NBRC 105648 TaxID=3032206 RepID=UPI0024A3E21D|nr:allantoicase [Actinokineospora sp. NBRC 105648]GLZ43008.1 putative allantoicase [Actinokineospora sp. NBRC 105648]